MFACAFLDNAAAVQETMVAEEVAWKQIRAAGLLGKLPCIGDDVVFLRRQGYNW